MCVYTYECIKYCIQENTVIHHDDLNSSHSLKNKVTRGSLGLLSLICFFFYDFSKQVLLYKKKTGLLK